MILITGSARIRPEHLDAALALGIEHSQRSRGEPGCIAHNCHVDGEDPQRIVFVEEWTDMAAVQAHFAVPASGEFIREIASRALTPPELRIFAAEEMQRPGS